MPPLHYFLFTYLASVCSFKHFWIQFAASVLKAEAKHGKKQTIVDENRRATYRDFHPSAFGHNQSALTTLNGNMKQLMPVCIFAVFLSYMDVCWWLEAWNRFVKKHKYQAPSFKCLLSCRIIVLFCVCFLGEGGDCFVHCATYPSGFVLLRK